MKTSKIKKSTYTKEWGTGSNKTYFHDIELEGENRTFNIGAKAQNPPFLASGQTLNWEFKDEAKGSIKKADMRNQPGTQSVASMGLVAPPAGQDLKISTGLIVATMLYTTGKITKEQINDIAANVARKFDEIKTLLG